MEPSAIQSLQQRLATAQTSARRLRAEAFVAYDPVVAGERLRPLTLDTYNLLIAWENPFVVGGSCEFTHLFQFIWAHHPDFGQHAADARHRTLRRVMRALQPRHPLLSSVAGLLCPLLSGLPAPASRIRKLVRLPLSVLRFILARFLGPTPADLEAAAIDECSRLVVEAIGEFPTDRRGPDSKSGALAEPLPFSLQAQILGLMCREFGLPFPVSRMIPLKELSQHLREATWVASRGKAILMTPAEAAIHHEYETAKEAELNAQHQPVI